MRKLKIVVNRDIMTPIQSADKEDEAEEVVVE